MHYTNLLQLGYKVQYRQPLYDVILNQLSSEHTKVT